MSNVVPVTEHALTVGQLIEKLREHPPGRRVVLATDSEGNGYSPVYSIGVALWEQHPQHAWIGDALSNNPDDYDFDPTWEDVKDLPTVVVVEPMN